MLAAELVARGHAVRGTTRTETKLSAIEAAGGEAVLGDPDVVGTLARSFEHVSLACVLLGSATGTEAELSALHGTRLEMLLTRMVDTTLRGVVYEATGSVDVEVLARGAALVQDRCEDAHIPYALLRGDLADHRVWTLDAADAVDRTLAGPGVGPR